MDTQPTVKPSHLPLSVGLSMLWFGILMPGSEVQFDAYVSGSIMAGLALGWIYWQSESKIFDTHGDDIGRLVYWFGVVQIAVAIGLSLYLASLYQIDGYDASPTIDAAYRIHCGQIPIRDFPCSFPPWFYLKSALAFKLFGVQWKSILIVEAIMASATFLWSERLLRQLFGERPITLLIALFIQAMNSLLSGFPSYDTMTTLADSMILLSALCWIENSGVWNTVSFAAAFFFAIGSKPNTAWALCAALPLCMLWKHPSQGNRLLGALAVATAIAVLTLEMSGITPLALMRSYAAVDDRCFSFDHFLANSSAWQKEVTISALATTGAIGLFAGSTMIESPCWICVAGFIMGVVGCVQNNSIWQDLSLIVLTVVLMTRDCRWPYLKRLTVAFIICLSIASSLNLFSRYSIRAGGPSAFYEYDGNQYVIQHGFFKDVHCGLLFATFMDEEKKVLNDCLYDGTEIPGSCMARLSSSSIWFGPRIGFSWVLHGFPPLTGEPLFWEPGTSFAKADEDRLFDQFMDRHYGTLILLKDCLYLKPEQSKRLLESYSVDQSYKTLTVLKRKPTSPVSH